MDFSRIGLANQFGFPGTPQNIVLSRPLFSRGSERGKATRKLATDCKEKADVELVNKEYEMAIRLYTDAIEAAVKVTDNAEQVAALFSNRSCAWRNLKQYGEAITDLDLCEQARPGWYRCVLRLMDVLKDMNQGTGAFGAALFALRREGEHTLDNRAVILTECVSLAPELPDGFHQLSTLEESTSTWSDVVKRLSVKNAWSSIKTLTTGGDNTEAVVESFDASSVQLSGLLQTCTGQAWTQWGQRLAVRLLQQGADCQSLDSDNKFGLHAAFNKASTSGTYELLKHLFLRHIPTADVNRVDGNGDTLLHLACSRSYPTQETAIRLLLNHKLDPTKKNKQDKYPIQLLSRDSGATSLLAQAMKDYKGVETGEYFNGVTAGESNPMNISMEKVASSVIPTANNWTNTDVRTWMNKHVLTGSGFEALQGLTGPQLAELRLMQNQAPEFFYSLLQSDLKLGLSEILKLSLALRNLS